MNFSSATPQGRRKEQNTPAAARDNLGASTSKLYGGIGMPLKSRGASSSATLSSSPVLRKHKQSGSESRNRTQESRLTSSRKYKDPAGQSAAHRKKASSPSASMDTVGEVIDISLKNNGSNSEMERVRATKNISFLGNTVSSSQAHFGEQLEPNQYQTLFSVSGSYTTFTCVPSSASIWAANSSNGCIDIFSACTGKLTSSLPPRVLLSKNQPLINKGLDRDRCTSMSSVLRGESAEPAIPTPTALHSTATHVWIGYSNGNVAICEHLVHTIVSEGCFHQSPLVAFSSFPDGSTVSGSSDGVLVHWDCEAKNFEAITRIKNRDASQEILSCLSAGESCWVAITGYESGAIYITDISDGKHSVSQRHHTRRVTSVVVLGDLVFSSAEDELVNIWRYDLTLLPLTTYTLAGCGGTKIHSLRLLRQIAVHPSVSSLSLDRTRNSLWVSYMDGLVERWSAHPDDSFGVEEVIREGVLPNFSEGGSKRRVAGIIPFTSVETVQVLALASNGLNNVWYGHYNVLEEKINQSVTALHKIITQDAVDTAEWRTGIEGLQQREQGRKERYVRLLEELTSQRLMRSKYELWKRSVIKKRAKNPKGRAIKKRESKVDFLLRKVNFRLVQRYFNRWVKFLDLSKKQQSRISAAEALASASRSLLQAAVMRRWMLFVVHKRVRMSSLHCIGAIERANRNVLLSRFYYKWFLTTSNKKKLLQESGRMFSKQQLLLVETQSQRRVLEKSMRKWHHAYHVLPIPTGCQASSVSSPLARFAELYVVMNRERLQRVFLHKWREWAARKKRYMTLYPLSALFLRQVEVVQLRRSYLIWMKFLHKCRINKIVEETSMVGKQIKEIENNHGDIAQKREYKNHIDNLLVQKKQEMEEIEQMELRIGNIFRDVKAIRDASDLKKSSKIISRKEGRMNTWPAILMAKNTEWYRGVLLEQRLLPSVLLQLPYEQSIPHVMSQLKANVINLYTDMALLAQMKERRQSGGKNMLEIFAESFKEIKVLMMPTSKKNARQKNTSIRWPLYMETLDSIPLHYCSPLVKAIKEMVISYEFLSPNGLVLLRKITDEILANADWIFLIFRACQLRRRPSSQIQPTL